jgi:hypothetical protein
MEIPGHQKEKEKERKANKKASAMNHGSSQNELNEQLSSKSLLANVLDINDDFIGNKYNTTVSSKNQVHMSRGANRSSMRNHHQNSQDPSYSPFGGAITAARGDPYLKRENSNLSQSGNYELSDASGTGGFFSSGASKNDINSVKRNLNGILREIKQITQKIKDDEEDENKELSWKFAAMVIDRLCLIIFSLCTLFSTVSILMTSKNFFVPSDPDPIF